jgi:hypothetical protein
VYGSPGRYGRLASAIAALIKAAVFQEGIFLALTFRARETTRPLDVKEVFMAILLSLELIHEINEALFHRPHSPHPLILTYKGREVLPRGSSLLSVCLSSLAHPR